VNERARYALAELQRLVAAPIQASSVPPAYEGDWDDPDPDPARLRPPARLDGFDVLYAAYAALTAPWERVDPKDEVGCPIAAEGWLARHGLLDEPLVHRYAALLGAPARPEAAVVLTHDVDDNFRHLFARRERWERLRRRPSLRRAASLAWSLRPQRSDPNDRFEEELGAPRTFFFASAGLAGGGDVRDVAYDIGHPAVASVVRRLADEGAEIGVHFSIASAGSSERMRAERETLERVAGRPVRSSRHHWWAAPTGRAHAEAGVSVDLSLGFNDRAGFRRGIASPFRPYGADDVWALPTIAMDAARPDLASLWRTVEGVGGLLVLDWHVHAANPANGLPYDELRRFLDETRPPRLTPLQAVA